MRKADPNEMTARQIFYSGRVQGVGFRATVRHIAAGFEVTGWVRNLDDGRVEMQAQTADADEMTEFLAAIDESHLAGHIRQREIHIIQPLVGVRGFGIVR